MTKIIIRLPESDGNITIETENFNDELIERVTTLHKKLLDNIGEYWVINQANEIIDEEPEEDEN